MALAIVIPTYNEVLTIERVVVALFKLLPNVSVIVVDDSSPDGTAKLVKSLQSQFPRLELVSRPKRTGLGGAYGEGFRYALDRQFDLIAQMDADYSHQPEDLAPLIAAASQVDFVVGSRYVTGGRIVGWTRVRLILSRLSNLYARLILGGKIRDWTGGFTVWNRQLLSQIPFEQLDYRGYFFQIALKYLAVRSGASFTELPITFKDREVGESKLNIQMFGEAFLGTIRLRLDTSNQIADTGNKP